ncbi:MAG: 16S rRNA (cytosine(1402)-N(4))-methyltransferase RsmH [Verrucomicrobiales bacterium]
MQFALPTPSSGTRVLGGSAAVRASASGAGAHFPPFRAFGTVLWSVVRKTIVRSGFHGWFAGRQSVTFQAERQKFLGTVLLSPITSRAAAGFHGWFAARPVRSFSGRASSFIQVVNPEKLQQVDRTGVHEASKGRPSEVLMDGSSAEGSSAYHVSVFPRETREWMEASADKFIIDGTLGGGGHSEMFLEAGATVLGVDRDPEAIAHATRRLSRFGDRFRAWQGNFADLRDSPEVRGNMQADGLLLDLGVSSRQLDAPERGFSFRGEGPLDMRMGPATEMTAADLVNTWSEEAIRDLLWKHGEEPRARKIAAAIIQQRGKDAFETTKQLADCIEEAVGRTGRTHPATRSFQAIRIQVNDELGSLERALEASVDLIKPGGRLLVITFHSLEDRMVKRFMQDRARKWLDQPDWPEPRPNPRWSFHLPKRKAIAPSQEEIRVNPRARSAKLRVAELLETKYLRS